MLRVRTAALIWMGFHRQRVIPRRDNGEREVHLCLRLVSVERSAIHERLHSCFSLPPIHLLLVLLFLLLRRSLRSIGCQSFGALRFEHLQYLIRCLLELLGDLCHGFCHACIPLSHGRISLILLLCGGIVFLPRPARLLLGGVGSHIGHTCVRFPQVPPRLPLAEA